MTRIGAQARGQVHVEPVVLPWNPRKLAFKVRNVLSPKQCRQLVQAVATHGAYEPALVHAGGRRRVIDTTSRNSDRCMVTHTKFAQMLFDRAILPILEPLSTRKPTPVQVNERLRFLRYANGQKFDRHHDNPYTRPSTHPNAGDTSRFTILLYLNDEYEGCTRFYSGWFGDRAQTYDVVPETGMAFVHEHDILHAGTPVTQGTKHCIRSDVMCRRSVPS